MLFPKKKLNLAKMTSSEAQGVAKKDGRIGAFTSGNVSSARPSTGKYQDITITV